MIVAGFGFRSGATADSLRDALAQTGAHLPDALATLDDKATMPAFTALADRLNRPVIPVADTALTHTETLTQSPASQAARNTGSVAEATALIAAGPGARLLAPRVISTDRLATCALAKGTTP